MPQAKLNYILKDHIPGCRFEQTGANEGIIRGPVDALSALGVNNVVGVLTKVMSPPPTARVYPFQRQGIETLQAILKNYGGALLADDMGLGKTRSAVWVPHLMKADTDSVLIVCPASVRHQWQNEVANVDQLTHFANLGPTSKKQFTADWRRWKQDGGYGAVSYNLMEQALAERVPTYIIFDEPHGYLSGRGNTYNKVLWHYSSRIRYKLALSGTPYTAKPAALWSILHLLVPMRFGKAKEFDVRYCNGHDGTHGWDNKGATNMAELSKRLAFYMVRRMKSEVMADMPAVTRTVRWIDGTPQATAALAACDYTVGGMQKAQASTLKEKMPEVINLVTEAGRPTIVFTYMREHCDQLVQLLHKAKQPTISIHGEYDSAQRAKMVQQAKDNNLHVVTTYGASSTGLDGLQHFSSNMVMHSINGVPATTLQAIDRLNRIGQKEPVLVTFTAMRDSIDELLVDKVINRLDSFGQIMGRDRATTSLQDALRSAGIDPDKALDAIFESMK